jgi:uncharacterized membrane protein YkvA (DUF1232 family)
MESLSGESEDLAISTFCPPPRGLGTARRVSAALSVWWGQAQRLRSEAHVFYLAFKHPGMPWYARVVAACTAGYLLSPIQLIPSFIPIVGFMDDFVVLFLGAKLLHRITPEGVMAECRELVKASEEHSRRATSSLTATVFSVLISAVWLLAALAATALMAAHFHH